MGQSDDIRYGEERATDKAVKLCEQMAVNLRANAINVASAELRRELEGCAETADQCALSIRAGRIITQFDKSVADLPKRTA